jgi:hypothetical protein
MSEDIQILSTQLKPHNMEVTLPNLPGQAACVDGHFGGGKRPRRRVARRNRTPALSQNRTGHSRVIRLPLSNRSKPNALAREQPRAIAYYIRNPPSCLLSRGKPLEFALGPGCQVILKRKLDAT